MTVKLSSQLRSLGSVATCFLLCGCSTFFNSSSSKQVDVDAKENQAATQALDQHDDGQTPLADDKSVNQSEIGADQIDKMIDQVDKDKSAVAAAKPDEIHDAVTNGIPQEINENVQKWINYFSGDGRELFFRYMQRGEKYRPMISKVFSERGLPQDLYYLAMIESGFATAATSRAKAVGIWQFIRPTAKRYGLRVDRHLDERRDPVRSTVAASLYLNDLHNVFQSWYLAMAAYNAGEARIVRAIMAGNTRDFWTLAKEKKLPRETMEYIPKFMAAVIIGSNPEKYGIPKASEDANPYLTSVTVPSPMSLLKIAEISGVSVEDLKAYNPHLRTGYTPGEVASYRIWVTDDMKPKIEAQQAQLTTYRVHNKHIYEVSQDRAADPPVFHVVRKKGQSLGSVAKVYGIPKATLKKLNNFKTYRLAVGTKVRLRADDDVDSLESSIEVAQNDKSNQEVPRHYKVRRGDSLVSVSKLFGVTVVELKNRNKLRRNRLVAGEVLKIDLTR